MFGGANKSDNMRLEMAIAAALKKEAQEKIAAGIEPEVPREKIIWSATFPALPKMKPIQSDDPVLFKQTIDKLRAQLPGTTINIYEIRGL